MNQPDHKEQKMTTSTSAPHHEESVDEEDLGLVYDIRTLVNRRSALGLFSGVTLTALLAACSSPTTASSSTASGSLSVTPDETAGPYPGDGSNGINVLDDSGIVRSDIRSSFGSSTTTAEGVPLTVTLTVRNATTGDALAGAAIYLWHCDRDGNYSLYSQPLTNENYLRGVQELDANGSATFTTVFPACYVGRWPHIHFEVYSDVDTAVAAGPIVKTSQLALPKETCDAVYATPGYERSISNLAGVSLASDNVFGEDQGIHQIANMSGSVDAGFSAALTIGV
jgi:protocatechuate 3,4-dioxygenase beta subunit